jgi:hypothetical protein
LEVLFFVLIIFFLYLGLLLDRDNDSRIGEKILKYVPFIPKILSKDVAIAQRKEAEEYHANPTKFPKGTSVDLLNDRIKQVSKL